MKIILLESLPKILKQDILDWNKATQSEKSEMLDEIIEKYNKPELFNIRPAIKNNFYRHGINPKENPFVNFLDTLKFKPTKKQDVNFMRLGDLIVSDHIDITKDYLTKESLYDRNEKDFIYTVKLFDIVNDRSKISKYFKDTTDINESELYSDVNATEIKPVGKEGDDVDTLYGTVEFWSGENGENDINNDPLDKGGYSLNQALSQLGIKDDIDKNIISWVKQLFKSAQYIYNSKSNDINDYLNRLHKILSASNKPNFNEIKSNKAFASFTDIPEEEKVNDNIVYVKNQGFVIWDEADNRWYRTSATNYKSNNKYIEAAKDRLFNEKIIEDKSDKKSIVAGILKILDSLDNIV